MKSAVEMLEPTQAKLTVEVAYDELGQAMEHAYHHIAEQIQVPGFRKGKVPPRIIDQRVGRDAVFEHALEDALPGLYADAVNEAGLTPLAPPEVDITARPDLATGSGELIFTADVEVRPEITFPDFAGVTVAVGGTEVSDEEVDLRLEALRGRFGTLKGVDRPAADGDFVQIDLTATIGEEEVESVTGISYRIGEGNMLDGLDEALIGLSAGETTTFEAPLAGGAHAGEVAQITVTATSVKEQELPEADDEFAEMASEFDTIEELRASLRTQSEQAHASHQAVEAQDKMLDYFLDNVEFATPPKLLASHIEEVSQGVDPDDEEALTEAKDNAEKAVRTQILLDALIDHLQVEVTQPELVDYLIRSASQFGMSPDEFVQMLDRAGQMPQIVGEVGRGKALTLALRRITVTDEDGNAIDLTPTIGSVADETPESDEAAAAAAAAVAAAEAGEAGKSDQEDGAQGPSSDAAPTDLPAPAKADKKAPRRTKKDTTKD